MEMIKVDITRRLTQLGFKNITVHEERGTLVGKALKGKRTADILFDRKGLLHIEMR